MLLNFIKSLFKSDANKFSEITPEFLEINRAKYTAGDLYLRWLKNNYGQLQAILIVKDELGSSVPQEWKDKVKLLEEYINKEQDRLK